MTQDEYITLTGMSLSSYGRACAYYDNIDMSKEDFCEEWKDFFHQSVIAEHLYDKLSLYKNRASNSAVHIEDLEQKIKNMKKDIDGSNRNHAEMMLIKAIEYKDADLYRYALQIVGYKEVIKIKAAYGKPLDEAEMQWLAKNL